MARIAAFIYSKTILKQSIATKHFAYDRKNLMSHIMSRLAEDKILIVTRWENTHLKLGPSTLSFFLSSPSTCTQNQLFNVKKLYHELCIWNSSKLQQTELLGLENTKNKNIQSAKDRSRYTLIYRKCRQPYMITYQKPISTSLISKADQFFKLDQTLSMKNHCQTYKILFCNIEASDCQKKMLENHY